MNSRHRIVPNIARQAVTGATKNIRRVFRAALISATCLGAAPVSADAADAQSRLIRGSYIAPMAAGIFPEGNNKGLLDDGFGGAVAVGYRKDFYAVEIVPTWVDLSAATVRGISLNALIFPLVSKRGVYGSVGLSGLQYADYETENDKFNFNTVNADAGLGFLWPLSKGRYDYALRFEARYRVGRRERDFNDRDIDLDAPRRFEQIAINVGVQLPTRRRPFEVKNEPEPVKVVAPPMTGDSDNDGVLDANDQCPGTAGGEQVGPDGCAEPNKTGVDQPETKAPSEPQAKDRSAGAQGEPSSELDELFSW